MGNGQGGFAAIDCFAHHCLSANVADGDVFSAVVGIFTNNSTTKMPETRLALFTAFVVKKYLRGTLKTLCTGENYFCTFTQKVLKV